MVREVVLSFPPNCLVPNFKPLKILKISHFSLNIGKNPSLTSSRDSAKIEYISGDNPHSMS